MNLKVSNLSCGFQNIPILSNVTFECPAGGIVILKGSNGIGKTTLLRCLAGLSYKLAGDFSLEEGSIAYLGHLNGLNGNLSVFENLMFWTKIYGLKDFKNTVSTMKLNDILHTHINTLSEGQQRMLALSRIHLIQRKCWILDEPMTALDEKNLKIFHNMLERHTKNNGSAIIATHQNLPLPLLNTKEVNLNIHKTSSKNQLAFANAEIMS